MREHAQVTRHINFRNYTGLDLSEQSLRLARNRRPDWNFILGDPITTEVKPRDMVLCLDVLIHQPTYIAYIALLGRLLSLAQKHLIVSGYNQPPWQYSEMCFYYEPLSASLRKLAPHAEIEIIGGFRDVSIIRLDIKDSTLYEQRLFDTWFGALWSKPDDLLSEQFTRYKAHTRNELAMLLSFVRPADKIVDIGSHIGSFAVPLSRAIGVKGHLICVEAEPVNAARLAQNLVLNNCDRQTELFNALVGPPNNYHYVPTDGNSGAGYFFPDEKGEFSETISLNSLCVGTAPNLIKIDVEGMEVSVLHSGESTIDKNRPLLYIEIAAAQLSRYGNSTEELESWLRSKNYRLFRNAGPRNSDNDDFVITELESLSIGVSLFDCLAIPSERLHDLVAEGKVPAESMLQKGSYK